MRSLAVLLGVALLCPLGGCGSSEDADRLVESYRSNLRQRQREQQKIVNILENVKDQASMAEALKQFREEYEKAALHPLAPMREPPPEVKERLQGEFAELLEGTNRVRAEFRRIQDLPGGEDFFDAIKKLNPQQGP
jgi:hypothetical protein